MKTKAKVEKVKTSLYLSIAVRDFVFSKKSKGLSASDIVEALVLSAIRPKADRRAS